MARLTWQRMNTTGTTAIVDDGDLGFTTGGADSGWHTAYYGYGGTLTLDGQPRGLLGALDARAASTGAL